MRGILGDRCSNSPSDLNPLRCECRHSTGCRAGLLPALITDLLGAILALLPLTARLLTVVAYRLGGAAHCLM